jgi:outer membrane usher protein
MPARGDEEEVLLAVQINRQPVQDTILALRRPDGRLLARSEDLQRWRFRLPDATPIRQPGGEGYHALDALPGLTYRVDEASQTLLLEAPPALFAASAVAGHGNVFAAPPPSPTGGFANYDIFANHVEGKTLASAQLEAAAFTPWGVGVSNFVGRSSGAGAHWVRLETTWTHDMPASISTLRIGDAINSPGGWGRAVRFGGVQYATNFVTQPTFITFPLPGFAGEAILPSTVDLYVNDALRLRREVPTGPFSIQDLPVVTGRGEMRLVVRDLLGRERVIVQPFYASARLLQRGLHDYSYELGFVREDFAIASDKYGRALAVGTHRFGFSDRFTGEAHGEVLGGQQTAGIGGALLWPAIGLVSASLAGSHGPNGNGGLASLGFERQAQRWSIGASTQVASERFVQLGLRTGEPAPRQVSRAFLSFSTSSLGSVGVSYTNQDYRDREGVELVSLSYSLSLGPFGFVSLSALRFLGGDAKTILGLNFTYPLDSLTSASAAVTGEPGSKQAQVRLQRNLPPGTGYGYRLLASTGDTDRVEAGVNAQNDYGTYNLEAARTRGETGYRASASAGVAFIGGSSFFSRRIDDSFAVVEVPGYSDVRVYAANQLAARTDRRGVALIPRLLPYQKNSVRIEQADLPMDAQIDSVQVDAMPYFRSGMRLPFPVRRSRGALLTIFLDNGEPLPAGAIVRVAGESEEFPAGLRGEVYVTGLGAANRLRASWRGQNCEMEVAFPPTADPLPHLGIHACRAVAQ